MFQKPEMFKEIRNLHLNLKMDCVEPTKNAFLQTIIYKTDRYYCKTN